MKLFTKCLVCLLSATLLLSSCSNKDGGEQTDATTTTASTQEGTAPESGDTRSLEEIYNAFIANVNAELPSLVQNTVANDMFSYYYGINKPDGVKETFVSEPMVGAMPFCIALLRVEGDASALAGEIKEKVDPRRWVCVTASYVETAVRDDVILLVMDGDNARGQEIIDAFKGM